MCKIAFFVCSFIASVGNACRVLKSAPSSTSAVKASKRDFNYSFIMLQNQELCEGTVELCIWRDSFLTQFHKVWLFSGYSFIKLNLKSEPPDCFFYF